MTRAFLLASLCATTLLAACGEDTGPVRSTSAPARQPQRAKQGYVPPPVMRRTPAPSAHVLSLPGLEGVIGASEVELGRQFGTPRLTVWEGDARKLQFAGGTQGGPCVLDVYLYPPTPGGAPRATYVDARRATDGKDVDRVACITALRALPRK